MTRIYDRETKHYDRAVLTHLVDIGEAQYYPAQGGIYVIKTEDGTVAVRPHQIIDMPRAVVVEDVVEVRVPSPMDGYSSKEEYDGEDCGPGGVVYDDALDLAHRVLARRGDTTTDPLILVRRILDERGYQRQLRAELDGTPARPSTSWVSASEQDEILGYFGI